MMLKIVGFGGEMSINLFFFFSGYFVLFAVDSDIGVFFSLPSYFISHFHFLLFSVKETAACQYLDSYQ